MSKYSSLKTKVLHQTSNFMLKIVSLEKAHKITYLAKKSRWYAGIKYNFIKPEKSLFIPVWPNWSGIHRSLIGKHLNILYVFIDSDRDKNSASNEPILIEYK